MCGADCKQSKLRFLKKLWQFLAVLRRFKHAKLQSKTSINGYWAHLQRIHPFQRFYSFAASTETSTQDLRQVLANLIHSGLAEEPLCMRYYYRYVPLYPRLPFAKAIPRCIIDSRALSG